MYQEYRHYILLKERTLVKNYPLVGTIQLPNHRFNCLSYIMERILMQLANWQRKNLNDRFNLKTIITRSSTREFPILLQFFPITKRRTCTGIGMRAKNRVA